MPGIVLRLCKKDHLNILKIYKNINKDFDEDIININQIPHISLMRIQKDFTIKSINNIENILNKTDLSKLNIKINGIGMFKIDDNKYVLYFKTIYTDDFKLLHKKIWKLLGKKVDLLQEDKYSPSSFSPHLTIPIFNPNKRNVLKIIKYLMDLDLNLNIISDKISFINTSKETGKVKIYFTKNLI